MSNNSQSVTNLNSMSFRCAWWESYSYFSCKTSSSNAWTRLCFLSFERSWILCEKKALWVSTVFSKVRRFFSRIHDAPPACQTRVPVEEDNHFWSTHDESRRRPPVHLTTRVWNFISTSHNKPLPELKPRESSRYHGSALSFVLERNFHADVSMTTAIVHSVIFYCWISLSWACPV